MLTSIGVEVSAAGVALHYGARTAGGVLDGWLVDETDAGDVERVESSTRPTGPPRSSPVPTSPDWWPDSST